MGKFLTAILRAMVRLMKVPFVFCEWAWATAWHGISESGQTLPPAPTPEAAVPISAVRQAERSTRKLALANAVARAARARIEGRKHDTQGIPAHVGAWLRGLHNHELEVVALADPADLRDHLAGLDPQPGLSAVDGYPPSAAPVSSTSANLVSLADRVARRRAGMLAQQDEDPSTACREAV